AAARARRRRRRRGASLDERRQLTGRAPAVGAGAGLGAGEAALLAAIDARRARHSHSLPFFEALAASPSLPRLRSIPRNRKLRWAPSRIVTRRSYTVGCAVCASIVDSAGLDFSRG